VFLLQVHCQTLKWHLCKEARRGPWCPHDLEKDYRPLAKIVLGPSEFPAVIAAFSQISAHYFYFRTLFISASYFYFDPPSNLAPASRWPLWTMRLLGFPLCSRPAAYFRTLFLFPHTIYFRLLFLF